MHYTLKEIDTVAKLLLVKNSTFFKRSISRLIAMRVDDFIKLGFATNKQTVRLQIIKDELNALEALYKDHLKLQRDKYSAHFQHLDFSDRLENWSALNFEKATFFHEIPKGIYSQFSTVPGYVPYDELTIDALSIQQLAEINNEFDLEAHPSIATDILSLTRPNSGGVLNFSMIHTKAGVLKSLELLIDYEWAMIQKVSSNREILVPFTKLKKAAR